VASETSALATVELRHSRHELHRRLSDEQQHWLADLYRANASAVYFVCKFLLRRPEDAADATQEVFLKAVESLRGRSTAGHARSWLLTAAQDHCLDVLRRHPQVDGPVPDPGADSGGVADPEAAVVERAHVNAVLGELRARERQALLMWAVERRPLAEIARELGLSYTAVQQLLFRARRHAASVAARVAAVLGLFQFGRVLRRASQAGQLALIAAVVPVVLASVPSTSSARQASSTPASHPAGLARTEATKVNGAQGPTTSGIEGTQAVAPAITLPVTLPVTPVLQVPVAPLPVPRVSVEGVTSTVNRQISRLEQSLGLPAVQPPAPDLPLIR
jgi:RNA polymerase sigma factor (sigma-70 family)